MVIYPMRPGVKKNKKRKRKTQIKTRLTKFFPRFFYKWMAFLSVMTWGWAMLWGVPPGGWAMPRHCMARRRLETRGWRPSVVVRRRIAPSGSRAGSRATPVGGDPLFKDADVGSLTLWQGKNVLLFLTMYKGEQVALIGTGTHLVWTELGPIQPTQCVLHVLPAEELHNALAVTLHVGKANVAGFTHVILQILPAPGWW